MADPAALQAQLDELQAGITSDLSVEADGSGRVRLTRRPVGELALGMQIVQGQLADATGVRSPRLRLTANGKGT